jgi:hypothetical protein
MKLESAEVVNSLKSGGLRATLIAVGTALVFGVVDQFTSKIIPTTAAYIQNTLFPPEFYVSFSPSTNVAAGVDVSPMRDGGGKLAVKKRSAGEPVFTVSAGPDTYILHLRGSGDKSGKVLVDQKQISKSGEIWSVNEVDRNWVSEAALIGAAPDAATSSPATVQPPAAGGARLSNTRWTVTEQDYAVLAQSDNKVRRSLLANALGEVGIYENGTEWEKRHIQSYSEAASWPVTPQHYPWGGSFLAWVLTQVYATPPTGSVSYLSWRRWAEEKPSTSIEPGMVGVFKLDNSEVPQANSRLLAGPIVRRQSDCVEIIVGNVSNRVVITCVNMGLFLFARAPEQ